jgi:exosortase E/protease (VPEID-CTERM system)
MLETVSQFTFQGAKQRAGSPIRPAGDGRIPRMPAITARMNLAWRITVVALLLVTEKFLLNFFVDFTAAQSATGLGAYVREAQHWGFRCVVTLAAALALFGYAQGNARLRAINTQARAEPLRLWWLALHGALFAPLAVLSYSFYGDHGGLQWPVPLLTASWLLVASGSVVALFAALAPLRIWRDAAISLGSLWAYALAAAVVAASAMQWSEMLWAPTTRITFELVDHILQPLIPTLRSNASTQVLDTGRFAVQISYLCSGLEGAGLLLAFCCAWLLYFRREYRFPRALLIIPVGLGVLFVLNILRIAALVLIGDAGYPDIAIYGFHSQAGWIAFNATAAGIAYFSRRSAWLCRSIAAPVAHVENPTTAYLLPLLAILAAGMLSRAASGRFEITYPLRLLAGALAIGYSWPKLRRLDWRFTWRGVAAGAGVFALWLGAAQFLTQTSPMPSGLADLSPLARTLWISARVLAAVVTVPIAEELAYRGYLLRRLKSADFDSVAFRDVALWALLVSSIAFGVAHGSWWLPGTAAGLVYGFVLMRTGRMGEAIAAHATTNGLIAVWVLGLQQWQLW